MRRSATFTVGMAAALWLGATAAAQVWRGPGGGLAVIEPWPHPTASDLQFSLRPEKVEYVRGEPLNFLITATNPTSEPVRLDWSSGHQVDYTLDGTYQPLLAYIQSFTNVTVPAGGSYTWTLRQPWSYYDLTVGKHQVTGQVVSYATLGPAEFAVITRPLPSRSFLLDFEQMGLSGDWQTRTEELWPYGLHLRNLGEGWGGPSIYHEDGRGFVQVNTAGYPMGFNIVVDFDMPVFGVSVDVSSAAGQVVTMIARDAQGNELGRVASTEIAAYRDWAGPISLTSTTPIASVEWWPTSPRASVLLDNLFVSVDGSMALAVPEPEVGVVLVAAVGGLAWRRGKRRK